MKKHHARNMRRLLDRLSPHMRRYLMVGVSVYIFELLVIVVAQQAGASNVWAVGISFWAGLIVSFFLQKLFTFGDKRMHHRILVPQLVAVTLLVFFNFGFTLLMTQLLQSIVPAVVSRTVALGITTIWNFYLYKTRIFTHDNS
jgi:putative flippase GtrA